MSTGSIYLAGIVLTFVLAIVAVVYLQRFLLALLVDICGTKERAGFWAAFSNLVLVAVPVIFAMFSTGEIANQSMVLAIMAQVRWALFGLVGTLAAIGLVICRFIPTSSQPG